MSAARDTVLCAAQVPDDNTVPQNCHSTSDAGSSSIGTLDNAFSSSGLTFTLPVNPKNLAYQSRTGGQFTVLSKLIDLQSFIYTVRVSTVLTWPASWHPLGAAAVTSRRDGTAGPFFPPVKLHGTAGGVCSVAAFRKAGCFKAAAAACRRAFFAARPCHIHHRCQY